MTAEGDRFLIEDDYDSEFRFSGRPIPPMQTMDFAGRVIYMNTFSKTIAPALRISYMILPPRLLDAWEEKMGFYSCTVPAFEQLTLTRFLDGGYFERHLSRMRKHYRAQLAALRAALAEPPFAEVCTILRADAGLHFVLQFRTDLTDDALQAKLRAAGIGDAAAVRLLRRCAGRGGAGPRRRKLCRSRAGAVHCRAPRGPPHAARCKILTFG